MATAIDCPEEIELRSVLLLEFGIRNLEFGIPSLLPITYFLIHWRGLSFINNGNGGRDWLGGKKYLEGFSVTTASAF